ncbi:MAG: hypothetical protein HUJ55_01970 [Ileibacterium sp.]|nr:hypothetical protein [Ileibacterium sp.]
MNSMKGKLRLRTGRAAAVAAGVSAVFFVGWVVYRTINPIRFKSMHPKVELSGDYDPRDNIQYVFGGDKNEVQIFGTVNTLLCGEYEIDYIYQSKTYPVTVTVVDTKGPELVLKDVSAGRSEEVDAESFVVSCSDPSRVSISITNPSVLDSKADSVNVEITAMDEYGNKTVKTAKLTRTLSPKAPQAGPVLQERTVQAGSPFEPLDLSTLDAFKEYESFQCDSSQVDANTPGTYTAVYTMTDSRGQTFQSTETIVVQDSAQAVPEEAEPSQEE